jgi:hypothetical protein
MLRTARLLRLEPCEDRSLPSVPTPISHPPADSTAHVSSPNNPAEPDEASEYANSANPGATTSNPPGQVGPALVPDYVIAAYPSAPPMPTVATPSTLPVIAAPAPPASIPVVPLPLPAPTLAGLVPPPPATPPPPAPPPPEDHSVDGAIDSVPAPQAATGDQPAASDTEFPPTGPVTSAIPFLENLDLRFNVADLAETATRLFDGLDAVVGLPDAESPWARLGYWALVVGTVGVAVELTRQGLRAKQPEPAGGPQLPVTR